MIQPEIIFSCLQQYCFKHIKAELAFLLCFSGCSLQLEFGTLVCHTTNPARMLCEHIILNILHLTKRNCVFLCKSYYLLRLHFYSLYLRILHYLDCLHLTFCPLAIFLTWKYLAKTSGLVAVALDISSTGINSDFVTCQWQRITTVSCFFL